MMIKVESRWKAFFIHVCISLIIFIILASVIRFIWYPGVLFSTEGGWQGIRLIAGVDLVIGPLLTLLTYNIQKKELARDMTLIAILQLACIFGGMYIVEQNRPIAIIYANNIYYTATRTQYEMYDINYQEIELLKQKWPTMISLDIPLEKNKRRKRAIQLHGEADIRVSTDLYRNYFDNISRLRSEGTNYGNKGDIKAFNLITRYGHFKVAVDLKTGKLIKLINE